jgi:regulator of cell morphogenesis and NO signaling
MTISSHTNGIAAAFVCDLVLENPARARVLERLGIDYCCGGARTLADACQRANRSISEVAAELERAGSAPPETDWRNESLTELAQYIVDKHHRFTQTEITRLTSLINKVLTAHGNNHSELSRLETLFAGLAEELREHMRKEEALLFPYISEMEDAARTRRRLPEAMFGTVQNPVAAMIMEHEASGQALEKIREITNGYVVPVDGCATYRALYEGLPAFAADLHQHIHLENNILFPRAVELESDLSTHARG